jgi:hypothetical protein
VESVLTPGFDDLNQIPILTRKFSPMNDQNVSLRGAMKGTVLYVLDLTTHGYSSLVRIKRTASTRDRIILSS